MPAERILPAQQGQGGDLDQPVGGLAEHGEDHDRRDDLRRLAKLLPVDQQEAEPSEAPMNSAATTNIQPSPSPTRSAST